MKVDRLKVRGGGDRLEPNCTPTTCGPLKDLVEQPSHSGAAMRVMNAYKVDVADLSRGHEPKQVREDLTVRRTDHEGRIAELAHEHRVMQRSDVTINPEVAQRVRDGQEIVDCGLHRLHCAKLAHGLPRIARHARSARVQATLS